IHWKSVEMCKILAFALFSAICVPLHDFLQFVPLFEEESTLCSPNHLVHKPYKMLKRLVL
ncbi:MAG: hypothetical protein NXI25_26140, partial [bacterium]|nr:hypothetical protein [bacterium]